MRVVVCGAGTAGCVVAARLSEDPGVEVVLLEVGPHYRPGRWPAALAHSHRIIKETHDWGYLARAGASPRIVHVPRRRVVGGSSVTNGAIALRGHPEHYDEWDTLVDGAGRVRGLEGLWVMDASVMARVPSANTHLAVIALAERLAARFAGREGPHARAPAGGGAT